MRGWVKPKPPSACPVGHKRLWKNGSHLRTIRTLGGPRTFRVRQWKCAECRWTGTDTIPGVEKGARYAKEVKREALRAFYGGETDLPAAVRRMKERLGWSPSPSTVERALLRAAERIQAPEAPSTGILQGDEKFVRVDGRHLPALVLRDTHDVVKAAEVLPDRSPDAIAAVLRPVVEAAGVHTLVTDPWKSYPVVARELGLLLQLCQFHLLKKLNERLHVYLSRKRWGMTREKRQREKRRIRSLFHAFCRSRRPARHLLAIAEVARRHKPLRKFVNHFLLHWRKFHTFRKVPGCPTTNNGSEGGIARLADHLRNLKGFRSAIRAQAFLALWALHANFRPYVSGKFAGLCPLQRAGVDTTGKDWLDCTGLAD